MQNPNEGDAQTGVAWPPRRIVAIVNPATHRPADPIVEQLKAAVPDGVNLDVRLTERAGVTGETALAALPGADLIVAVGGDGTTADVAGAIGAYRDSSGVDVPLAVIPAGSTNITSRELRIPRKIAEAIDLLYGRRASRFRGMDLCQANDRLFLHMAGSGLDSRLFSETNHDLKRRVGWLAYVPPTLKNLRIPPAIYRIETDGTTQTVESPLVLIANGGGLMSPRVQLYPGIRSDDGVLDVLIFTPASGVAILRTLGRTATRSLDRSPYVVRLRAKEVTLDADSPQPVQVDGDVALQTPVRFAIRDSGLRVVVPAP
jgi:YegS/Rv2252/BmrU family lipid kinase